jgi:hypothetical protein
VVGPRLLPGLQRIIPQAAYIYLSGSDLPMSERVAEWRANMLSFSLVSKLWRVRGDAQSLSRPLLVRRTVQRCR